MLTGCGFIAVGLFFLFGAICNWAVLMNSVKARMWIKRKGTTWTRVFLRLLRSVLYRRRDSIHAGTHARSGKPVLLEAVLKKDPVLLSHDSQNSLSASAAMSDKRTTLRDWLPERTEMPSEGFLRNRTVSFASCPLSAFPAACVFE